MDSGATISNIGYLRTIELPRPEAIVSPHLITRNSITLLFADEDSFKTQFATQLAVCLNAGIPFLDYETIPSNVVYYTMEGVEGDIVDRILEKGEALAVDTDDIGVCPCYDKQLDRPGDYEKIKEMLRDRGSDVVIFDPVTYVIAGDVRFSPTMLHVVSNGLNLATTFGIAIVFVIHTRKDSPKGDMHGFLGSNILTAASATRIRIDRSQEIPNQATLTFRTRYDERPLDRLIMWHTPLLQAVGELIPKRQQIKQAINEELSFGEVSGVTQFCELIARKVACDNKSVRHVIADMIMQGQVRMGRVGGSATKTVCKVDVLEKALLGD